MVLYFTIAIVLLFCCGLPPKFTDAPKFYWTMPPNYYASSHAVYHAVLDCKKNLLEAIRLNTAMNGKVKCK